MEKDGEPFDSGLREFGVLIGDGVVVYTGGNWRGILLANMVAKDKTAIEVVMRRVRET